jgi:hypothetical protein
MPPLPVGGVVLPQREDHIVVDAAGYVRRDRDVGGFDDTRQAVQGRHSRPGRLERRRWAGVRACLARFGRPPQRALSSHLGVELEGVRNVDAGLGVLVEREVSTGQQLRVSKEKVSEVDQKRKADIPRNVAPCGERLGRDGAGSRAGAFPSRCRSLDGDRPACAVWCYFERICGWRIIIRVSGARTDF